MKNDECAKILKIVNKRATEQKKYLERKQEKSKKKFLIKILGYRKYFLWTNFRRISFICLYLSATFKSCADKFNKKSFEYKPEICMENKFCFDGSIAAYYQSNPRGRIFAGMIADKFQFRDSPFPMTDKGYNPQTKEMFENKRIQIEFE